MTQREVENLLGSIKILYPSFYKDGTNATVIDMWYTGFQRFSVDEANSALLEFSLGDIKGIAPMPANLIGIILEKRKQERTGSPVSDEYIRAMELDARRTEAHKKYPELKAMDEGCWEKNKRMLRAAYKPNNRPEFERLKAEAFAAAGKRDKYLLSLGFDIEYNGTGIAPEELPF